MPRGRDEPTAGEWAALAIVAELPTHGFAVAKALAPAGEVGRVWAMRRPLVYRALETLTTMGLVRSAGTADSPSGPPRTLLAATPDGERAITGWLRQPVEHVRDARSLLMLKLLFTTRRDADPAPLLDAQRELFARVAQRVTRAMAEAEGFDRTLLRWRLESATAAVRFVEALLAESADVRPVRR